VLRSVTYTDGDVVIGYMFAMLCVSSDIDVGRKYDIMYRVGCAIDTMHPGNSSRASMSVGGGIHVPVLGHLDTDCPMISRSHPLARR